MKSISKIVLYTVIIFLLATTIISIWYILDVGESIAISFVSLKNIVIRYGFVGGIIIAVFFFAICISYLKIKNPWILSLITITLIVLLAWSGFIFFWYFVVSGFTDSPFVD